MKKIYVILVFVSLLIGCNDRQIKVEDDLTEVKTLIIKEYLKYDAKYFSDRNNCLFEKYIENNFKLDNLSIGHVLSGIRIYHYKCGYNNFNFALIKNSLGKYYYIGFSDGLHNELMIKNQYTINYNSYISKKDSLIVVDNDKTRETVLINKIINEEPLLKEERKKHKSYFNNYLIFSLIYHIYFERSIHPYIYTSQFKIIYGDLENELLKLRKDTVNTKEIDKIVSKYDGFRSKYMNKKAYHFSKKQKGVYIFIIEEVKDSLKFSKKYIPSTNIFLFPAGQDFNAPYDECYELSNETEFYDSVVWGTTVGSVPGYIEAAKIKE